MIFQEGIVGQCTTQHNGVCVGVKREWGAAHLMQIKFHLMQITVVC